MTNEQIAVSWALRGDAARAASFSTDLDATGTQRWFQADIEKLGHNQTVAVRVWKIVGVHAKDEVIEAALDALYADLTEAVANAPKVGGKFD